jgi:hypothetical protein
VNFDNLELSVTRSIWHQISIVGFAVFEAVNLAEAVKYFPDLPCAVAHGVVELWTLEEAKADMRIPVLTVAVLITTFGFTCAEHLHPSLLGLLQRDPDALSHYQWWRLFTPLIVQPDPWPRALAVFLLFLIIGALSERLWKRRAWLILYLVCGLTGEIAGYFWQPYNAGMSVAGAGLLGGLAAGMIVQAQPWQAKMGRRLHCFRCGDPDLHF